MTKEGMSNIGLSGHSGMPRIQRNIEAGARNVSIEARENEPEPVETEHEIPKIVMPPPPVAEDTFNFLPDEPEPVEGEPEGDEDAVANPGAIQVAVPQSTGFIRLNKPEDER